MKIKWTEPAIKSLQAIENYISLDSEYYAKVYVEKIIQQVDKLEDFPSIGRIVPEYKKNDIREILFGNYRIVYHLHSDCVVILNIIHASRDFVNAMRK